MLRYHDEKSILNNNNNRFLDAMSLVLSIILTITISIISSLKCLKKKNSSLEIKLVKTKNEIKRPSGLVFFASNNNYNINKNNY